MALANSGSVAPTASAITPLPSLLIRRPENADACKRSKNTGFLLKFETTARHRGRPEIAQTARIASKAKLFAEHHYGEQNIANVRTFAACAEILVRCKSLVSSLYAAKAHSGIPRISRRENQRTFPVL